VSARAPCEDAVQILSLEAAFAIKFDNSTCNYEMYDIFNVMEMEEILLNQTGINYRLTMVRSC